MTKQLDAITGKTVPVFFYYALPNALGMLAISSASLIDGVFLGNYVGSYALAAVNLTIPLGSLLLGIVLMFSLGGSVVAGKYLGEGEPEQASGVFTKTLVVVFSFCLAIILLGILFIHQLIPLLGATESLRETVYEYLIIILCFLPFQLIGFAMSFFVRVDGRPVLASAGFILSSVLNVLLDWVMIGLLDMGVRGAAFATGIAHLSICIVFAGHFLFGQSILKLSWTKDRWKDLVKAAFNGFSEFISEISGGVVTFIFNWIMVRRMGVEGVAAFTVVGYLMFMGLIICYGISDSLQPLISKNFGAQQPKRISSFLRLAVVAVLSIGGIMIFLLVSIPEIMTGVFMKSSEENTLRIAMAFISVFWPAFVFNGANITFSAYFTAMQKPIHSACLALSRSLVLPVIFLLVLPNYLGDTGVYIAIPLTEALTFVLGTTLLIRNRPALLVSREYGSAAENPHNPIDSPKVA